MTFSIRLLLTFSALASVACVAGCASTTNRIGPSEAALNNFGVQEGDIVLIRYADGSDGKSSTRSEQLKITAISNTSISGLDEDGMLVEAAFDDLYQIETKTVKPANISHSPAGAAAGDAVAAAGKASWKVLKTIILVLYPGY